MAENSAKKVDPDDLRTIVGRQIAFEAMVLALVATHHDRAALRAAFHQSAEAMTTHMLNLPLSDLYRDAFEKARAQILRQLEGAR